MIRDDELRARIEAAKGIEHGCSDGGCAIKRPVGMHTNGGCKCFKEGIKDRKAVSFYRNFARPSQIIEFYEELIAARAEIDRLRELIRDMEGCSGPCDSFGICSACTARALVDHD